MKKYYYAVYWERNGNGFSHDVRMEPTPFVTDMHPAEWVKEWKKRGMRNRVLGSWQEISEEDFKLFRVAFN